MSAQEPVVLVVDRESERVVERCVGPNPDGSCPHVADGAVVACAGQRILLLEGDGIDGRWLEVACTAVHCPVAAATATGAP